MPVAGLRQAALRALLRFDRARQARPPDTIVRIAVDVGSDGAHEIVSMRVESGELAWSCTCREATCDHALCALQLLAYPEGGPDDAAGAPASDPVSTSRPPSLTRSQQPAPPRGLDMSALAESLEDVVTAVVRTGLADKEPPSVTESLGRLVAAAPEPLPLGVSRWIGRLRWELSLQDPDGVARMLDGAVQLAEDLDRGTTDSAGQARILSFLGPTEDAHRGVEAVSDRIMVELGRELVDGVERVSIERRYLLDLDRGELFREEQVKGRKGISLGTCPRLIHVGLAEVERAATPCRIRLLQYASSPNLSAQHWRAVGAWAAQRFAGLVHRYRAALSDFPGLSEPIAWLAPEGLSADGGLHLRDEQGATLPLSGGSRPAILAYLKQRLAEAPPEFMLGRLSDQRGALHLRPVAAGMTHRGRFEHLGL